MHRVENPGEGGSSDFCQNPLGESMLSGQNWQGVPILGFIRFFINMFFENLLGGPMDDPLFPLWNKGT